MLAHIWYFSFTNHTTFVCSSSFFAHSTPSGVGHYEIIAHLLRGLYKNVDKLRIYFFQDKNAIKLRSFLGEPSVRRLANSVRLQACLPRTTKDIPVGTLQNGYIQNVPLPRVAPRIQSASHVMSHGAEPNTCYLQVTRVPMCRDPNRSLKGLGGNGPCLFSPVGWCRPLAE